MSKKDKKLDRINELTQELESASNRITSLAQKLEEKDSLIAEDVRIMENMEREHKNKAEELKKRIEYLEEENKQIDKNYSLANRTINRLAKAFYSGWIMQNNISFAEPKQ